MRIKSLQVNALHGFLDINLVLRPDLTVIVGPNGSGKTSALMLIAAMLRLDFTAIKSIEFREAALAVEDDVLGEVTVHAANSDSNQRLPLARGDSVTEIVNPQSGSTVWYFDSSAPLFRTELPVISKTFWSDALIQSQPEISASQQAQRLAAKLAAAFVERAKLTFVQLDRTIVAMDAEGNQALENRASARPRASSKTNVVRDPMEEVIRVTKQRYLEYKSAVERIKDQAYLESLRLHFKPINPALQEKKMEKKAFNEKLRDLRERVDKSSMTSDQPELREFAKSFFDQFQTLIDASIQKSSQKRLGRRTLDDEQLEAILNLKQLQIEDLLNVFESEYRSTNEAYAPIRQYLNRADQFLKESGKRLTFDPSYEMRFTIDAESNSPKTLRSLKELSSGERQVLIILSYLTFVSGNNSVFVIDEPELSLHIAWQGYLIQALQELRPADCQIVLATHSPEIAGRALENCTNLTGGFSLLTPDGN